MWNLIFLQDGKEVEIQVDVSFATITKPNSAVIAADKMNVVYRGVQNPITISIPGIQDSKIRASAPGLKRIRGSKYNLFPGKGREVYQVETSDWHRKNMGRMYKHNENIPFTMVPDLSIYLLQKYQVQMSWNEFQAIRIHDGIYDDANKPYFIARSAQAKLKTNLPLLLHHADHMASQIEYEKWRSHKNNSPNPVSAKTKATKKTAIKNLAEQNPDIDKSISDIFKTFGDS